MPTPDEERAVWTTAYIDTLPDSSFLYIEPGGEKDAERKTTPRSLRHFPYRDENGKIDLPHLRDALSRIPQSSLPADVKTATAAKAQRYLADATGGQNSQEPPRDDLVRAVFPAEFEIRDDSADAPPTMVGHFAVFDQWTEINSRSEGNFLERISPGAFRKTFSEQTPKVLFNHGQDPAIGNKVLGSVRSLTEDATGASYEVELHDTSYNRDLLPGLKAGEYGASFRFRVIRQDYDEKPQRSDYNPNGLPERTITEAGVAEFGPVTFPAYPGATAGVRSMTDEWRMNQLGGSQPVEDREESLAPAVSARAGDESAVSTTEDAPSHPAPEPRRDTQPQRQEKGKTSTPKEGVTMSAHALDEHRDEVKRLADEIRELASEYAGRLMDDDAKSRYASLKAERDEHLAIIKETEERQADLDAIELAEAGRKNDGARRGVLEEGAGSYRVQANRNRVEDPFDQSEYVGRATSEEHLSTLYTEGARRAIERFDYPHERAKKADVDDHLDRLVRHDSRDKEIARRFTIMGSPAYRSAFWKSQARMPLNREEQAAMLAAMQLESRAIGTSATGGVTVPIQIDPTLIPVSNGVQNPFRLIARNVTTTSYQWSGVTQAGITFTYRAEGTTSTDNSPTLVARPITPERADAFIPFSLEVGMDWGNIEGELAGALADGKDAAEATKFAVGAGHASNEPQGVLIGAGTVIGTTGNTAFAVADVYALENNLPARYQQNATWLMTNAMAQKVRQFSTTTGPAAWAESLQVGQPANLLGHPAYKASTVGTAGSSLTSTARWGVIGDFSRFVIVDRIGMQVTLIDQVFSGNTAAGLAYPTGYKGLYAIYRNSSGVVDSNAFRVGTIT